MKAAVRNALVLLILLNVSPLIAQPQTFGFHDISLGMSLREFHTKYPAPGRSWAGGNSPTGRAVCSENAAARITTCSCNMSFLRDHFLKTAVDPLHHRADREQLINLRITLQFIREKLALIEVEPPFDSGICFNSPSSLGCDNYPSVFRTLTGNLGMAVPSMGGRNLTALRWENNSSVAEFQNYMCGPWDGTNKGWSKAIGEVIDGKYCGPSDSVSARQPVMFYLDKGLGRTLAIQLEKTKSN